MGTKKDQQTAAKELNELVCKIDTAVSQKPKISDVYLRLFRKLN